jgi:hypothetical protein
MELRTSAIDQPSKSLRFQQMGIAVSVFFRWVTVLLCILWLRSYQNYYEIQADLWRPSVLRSQSGSLGVMLLDPAHFSAGTDGRLFSRLYVRPVREHNEFPQSKERAQLIVDSAGFFVGETTAGCIELVVPFWFLILSTALCALIPELIKPRRFSLRTMLIATTLVAVLLGLGAWLLR